MKKSAKSVFICLFSLILVLATALTAKAEKLHDWGEWVIDKTPTCTQTGHRYRVCDADQGYQHTEEESLPTLEHDYSIRETKPSCKAVGTQIYECKKCDYSYMKSYGEKTVHTYKETISKESTCQEEGLKTFACSLCGDSYSETLPKIEHIYKEKITKQASCLEAAEKTFTCTLCDDTYISQYGEKSEHILQKTSEEQEGGLINYMSCTTCDYRIQIAIEEIKKPLDAVTLTNIALAVSDVSLVLMFAILIYPDFVVLLWHRRLKKGIKTNSVKREGDK